MQVLEGKPIADAILIRVKEGVAGLGRMPGFGAILVGDDPASKMYVALKKKTAHACGMLFCDYTLPQNATDAQVLEVVSFLNHDEAIDGILVQLPLPRHLDRERIINAIDPNKDVDGLTKRNQICLREDGECFVCPFPKAILAIAKASGTEIAGKTVAIVANSDGFGKTMAGMFAAEGAAASYALFDEGDAWKEQTKNADIIVTATGNAGSICSEDVRDGAVIIDGGIEKKGDSVRGDADAQSFANRNVILTPVPNGVGPVTVACLIENVYFSSARRKI